MQIRLRQPSEAEAEYLAITKAEIETWMTPIVQYLEHGTCKPEEEKTMKQQCSRYTMINQDLYRKGYSTSLLKCVTKNQAKYVLKEIHERVCGNHLGVRTMATKVFKVGYYWPTLQGNCAEFVKKCAKCQEFGPMHHQKSEVLHNTSFPWPFAIWEMDIIGPFAPGKGQTKFLIVGVEYITKWIEVELLASAKNMKNFVWRSTVVSLECHTR